ncbi:hypothetical protein PAECIP111893_03254 [Paenibacillus plantiphilus]|uniref:YesK-like protein n=1 Tax=Paenibacillus plantiphilus TaxID=2905650 RepID=A0ABM9CDJ1_9BACL|nr:hypothetical protein [Paenibacillus plantiphilus]CAH1210717.1 hypothetical protein PAECIP111893_03254 [Paenibacillus plantiphilus]
MSAFIFVATAAIIFFLLTVFLKDRKKKPYHLIVFNLIVAFISATLGIIMPNEMSLNGFLVFILYIIVSFGYILHGMKMNNRVKS